MDRSTSGTSRTCSLAMSARSERTAGSLSATRLGSTTGRIAPSVRTASVPQGRWRVASRSE
jgi:hypothetical protein